MDDDGTMVEEVVYGWSEGPGMVTIWGMDSRKERELVDGHDVGREER